jgi:hypothetical protein
MSVTDEQIRAAVDAAQYSDPDAAEYLIRKLIERRDKVGRRFFSRVNPLDRFALVAGQDGWVLTFDDLSVDSGLESAAETSYRYTLHRDGRELPARIPIEKGTRIVLDADAIGAESAPPGAQWECRIETSRGRGGWSRAVRVYLERDAAGLVLVGLRRDS